MEAALWVALVGVVATGGSTLIGIALTNRGTARQQSSRQSHELAIAEMSRRNEARRIRRDLALPALQRFSAQAEKCARAFDQCYVLDGFISEPTSLDLSGLIRGLEAALVDLELLATEETLQHARDLVRLSNVLTLAGQDSAKLVYWETVGNFRGSARNELFGEAA